MRLRSARWAILTALLLSLACVEAHVRKAGGGDDDVSESQSDQSVEDSDAPADEQADQNDEAPSPDESVEDFDQQAVQDLDSNAVEQAEDDLPQSQEQASDDNEQRGPDDPNGADNKQSDEELSSVSRDGQTSDKSEQGPPESPDLQERVPELQEQPSTPSESEVNPSDAQSDTEQSPELQEQASQKTEKVEPDAEQQQTEEVREPTQAQQKAPSEKPPPLDAYDEALKARLYDRWKIELPEVQSFESLKAHTARLQKLGIATQLNAAQETGSEERNVLPRDHRPNSLAVADLPIMPIPWGEKVMREEWRAEAEGRRKAGEPPQDPVKLNADGEVEHEEESEPLIPLPHFGNSVGQVSYGVQFEVKAPNHDNYKLGRPLDEFSMYLDCEGAHPHCLCPFVEVFDRQVKNIDEIFPHIVRKELSDARLASPVAFYETADGFNDAHHLDLASDLEGRDSQEMRKRLGLMENERAIEAGSALMGIFMFEEPGSEIMPFYDHTESRANLLRTALDSKPEDAVDNLRDHLLHFKPTDATPWNLGRPVVMRFKEMTPCGAFHPRTMEPFGDYLDKGKRKLYFCSPTCLPALSKLFLMKRFHCRDAPSFNAERQDFVCDGGSDEDEDDDGRADTTLSPKQRLSLEKLADVMIDRFKYYCRSVRQKIGLGCFPESATLSTRDGNRLITDVPIGTDVLVAPGVYEPLLGWLHRDSDFIDEFVQIGYGDRNVKNEQIVLTHDHLLPITRGAENGGSHIFVTAGDVRIGDILHGTEKAVKVSSVARIPQLGAYAPLTSSGRIVVDGIITSCYTSPKLMMGLSVSHQMAHAAMAPLRWYYGLVPANSTAVVEPGVPWWPALLYSIVS